jgi:hypothetical protein
MKTIFIILFAILFLKADDKVELDSTLLPKLNFEVFEAKRQFDKLKEKEDKLNKKTIILSLSNNSLEEIRIKVNKKSKEGY